MWHNHRRVLDWEFFFLVGATFHHIIYYLENFNLATWQKGYSFSSFVSWTETVKPTIFTLDNVLDFVLKF